MKLGIYQHYNQHFYQVSGIARHSETLEEMVIYQAMQGDYGIWVRPLTMFEETVDIDGEQKPRFTYVGESFSKAPSLR
jgi:hypothetical protein